MSSINNLLNNPYIIGLTASNSIITPHNSDTTCFIPFVNDTPNGSSQSLKGNSSLKYNSSTNSLTVSSIGVGTTPSATLDVSGTARITGFISYGVDGIIRSYRQSIPAGGTLDLDIGTTGGGFQGLLIISNTRDSDPLRATYTTYSVFGRGTTGSIQQISTHNGVTSGCPFTVSISLTIGVLRVKNTDSNTATVSAQYIGGTTI